MQSTLTKFGHILRKVQHAKLLSLSAYNFAIRSNTDSDRTTHFGFETVTEADKEQRGLFCNNEFNPHLIPFNADLRHLVHRKHRLWNHWIKSRNDQVYKEYKVSV